jgi:tRNA (guanine37-N1)-methyltransferase
MRIDVVTLFPDFIHTATQVGVIGRAQERQLLEIVTWNPRDYSNNKHNRVDERPFGGGPGMVMSVPPLQATLAQAIQAAPMVAKVIHLSPQGQRLTQAHVSRLSQEQRLLLLCGRYEGIDERFINLYVDEELSIGDYVLSGGELGATVLIDAIGRLKEGTLGNSESAQQDSFSDGLLDCPHYTRPKEIEGLSVPDVLLSGDHAAIARWRLKQKLGRTWLRRPDLLSLRTLTPYEQSLLAEFCKDYRHQSQ